MLSINRTESGARVDRRVGLDEPPGVIHPQPPVGRADDAGSDRLAKAEGVADRKHVIANRQLAAVAGA